jgi:hypothetical protein
VAADQFLDATLVLKDPDRTSLFICEEWSVEEATAEVAAPTEAGVSASWGAFNASIEGARARVSARVSLRYPDSRREIRTWTLTLVDEDGWRVCDVTKETSLDP